MLCEIECDEFKAYGKPRGKIRFHAGLNSILGDKDAQNSIGKSTFMLIIDFCFGGNDYLKNNAKEKVGNHTIKFAFSDTNENMHYFARDTLHPSKVNICDEDYYPETEISADEFRGLLKEFYGITIEDASFRDIVGRFLRIYGRETCNEKRPISISNETDEKAIFTLEKMFYLYDAIKDDYEEYLRTSDEKTVYKEAKDKQFITYAAINNQKEYEATQKDLVRLKEELRQLDLDQDVEITSQEAETLDEVRTIKAEITNLKHHRERITAQRMAVQLGSSGERLPLNRDIAALQRFFPNANIKQIDQIQAYHRKMQGILESEVNEEVERLDAMLNTIDERIKEVEADLREYGCTTKLSMDFLNKHTELSKRIDATDARLQEYERSEQIKQDAKDAEGIFKIAQDKQLRKMESTINEDLIKLNENVYNGERYAPSIDFRSGKSYEYRTPDDDGTGTAYRNLILFDLAMLELTELPVVAHDSVIFKNIAVMPIDDIMKLYTRYEKQIFIVFDKKDAITDVTRDTLEKTKVLELEANGGELFGWSWAKRVTDDDGNVKYKPIKADTDNKA